MSMRLIEENEQHFTSNNSGKWEKEIEDRLHECHTQVLDMMVDIYGTPMKDYLDGLVKRVQELELKLKRLETR